MYQVGVLVNGFFEILCIHYIYTTRNQEICKGDIYHLHVHISFPISLTALLCIIFVEEGSMNFKKEPDGKLISHMHIDLFWQGQQWPKGDIQ